MYKIAVVSLSLHYVYVACTTIGHTYVHIIIYIATCISHQHKFVYLDSVSLALLACQLYMCAVYFLVCNHSE